jgi:hypothetical protein
MRRHAATDAHLLAGRPEAAYAFLACGLTWALTTPLWTAALGCSKWAISPHWTALGALGPLTAASLVTLAEKGRDVLIRWWRGLFAWRTTPWRGFLTPRRAAREAVNGGVIVSSIVIARRWHREVAPHLRSQKETHP